MPTSVRLDPAAERLLRRLAARRGQTKSEVIRDAIRLLAQERGPAEPRRARQTAYDRMAHVVGVADSGGAGLSERTGERFRDLLVERTRVRRSD